MSTPLAMLIESDALIMTLSTATLTFSFCLNSLHDRVSQ